MNAWPTHEAHQEGCKEHIRDLGRLRVLRIFDLHNQVGHPDHEDEHHEETREEDPRVNIHAGRT